MTRHTTPLTYKPSISVAMATYNGGAYLAEQLESLLSQTRRPDEVVICDDGSTDLTLQIAEQFKHKASFDVRILTNEKTLGYTGNFGQALSHCTGDFIFLSDQDDVWYPEKLDAMGRYLTEHPACMVLIADMHLGDRMAQASEFTQLGNLRSVGFRDDQYCTGCATVIRRQWLQVVLPMQADVAAHDYWIHRLAVAMGVRDILPVALQCYRRHGNNESRWLASQPRRITQLDALRTHGFANPAEGWRSELLRIQAVLARLTAREACLLDLGLDHQIRQALSQLVKEASAHQARLELLDKPSILRILPAINMWQRGDYQVFRGWKSLIKDVVRP